MNVAAFATAVVLFVLAGLGANVGALGELDLVAFGLAAVGVGLILPR